MSGGLPGAMVPRVERYDGHAYIGGGAGGRAVSDGAAESEGVGGESVLGDGSEAAGGDEGSRRRRRGGLPSAIRRRERRAAARAAAEEAGAEGEAGVEDGCDECGG